MKTGTRRTFITGVICVIFGWQSCYGAIGEFATNPTFENFLKIKDSIVNYSACEAVSNDCFKALLDPPDSILNFGTFRISAQITGEVDRDVTFREVQNISPAMGYGADAVGVFISPDRRFAEVQMDITRNLENDLVDPFDGIVATAEFIFSQSGVGMNAVDVTFSVDTFLDAAGNIDPKDPRNPTLITDAGLIVNVKQVDEGRSITYDFPVVVEQVVEGTPVDVGPGPAPSGRTQLTLNPNTNEIVGLIGNYENLNPITGIGLYGPAAIGELGPIITSLDPSLVDSLPVGSGAFDFYPMNGDGFLLTDAQQLALIQGDAYIKFLTDLNPTGEIRGQVLPVVPEPSSALLSLFAGLSLSFVIRKRRS